MLSISFHHNYQKRRNACHYCIIVSRVPDCPFSLTIQKESMDYFDLCSKMHLFQSFFVDFKLWWLTISKPVDLGKSQLSQKKPWNMANENFYEIVSRSTMSGNRWVLVKVVLIPSEGRGNFQKFWTRMMPRPVVLSFQMMY